MDGRMGIAHYGSRLIARTAWILAAILTASTFLSIYRQPVGWLPGLVVTGLALGAACSSYNALLVLAGLAPLSATIFALLRNSPVGLDFGEAMVLGVLAGWCTRRSVQLRPLAVPQRFAWSAGVLLVLALASGAVEATVFRAERPDWSLTTLTQYFLTQDYFIRVNTIRSTMLYVEGVALMILATDACGGDRLRRDRLLRMMVLGAATAAFFNVMKILTSAMSQPDPWSKFLVYFATARLNIHFPDLNAAGSYFALMLFVALGFTARAGVAAAIASVVIFGGLWVAGSRTALAVALAGFGVGASLMGPGRYRKLLAVVAPLVLVLVAVAAWKLYPQGRNAAGSDALAFRVLMGKAAVDMISAHPVFGVGPGHFAELSGPFQNNAHNNFLQIGAELGIPAAALFVIVAWFAVRASWREADTWGTAQGLSLGLVAFLATCLAGHPLLVSGAAYPFWIALGLAAYVDPHPAVSRRVPQAGIIAIAIIAATLPFRMSAAKQHADVEHASVGFSNWQQESDGSRYRWAGGHAWFFVAPAARSVRIPMRLGPAAPAVVEVRLFLDGIEANRVVLRQGDDVRTVRLNLLRRATTPFARIDLESRIPGIEKPLDARPSDSGGILRVDRPIFEN